MVSQDAHLPLTVLGSKYALQMQMHISLQVLQNNARIEKPRLPVVLELTHIWEPAHP